MTRSIGFNIVGHLSGNLGLGVSARHVAQLVLDRNRSLAVLDLDPGFGRGGHDQTFCEYAIGSGKVLPHEVTLLVLPPQGVFALAKDPTRRWILLRRDGLQCALLFWEQAQLPRRWLPALQMLDVAVASSHFIGSACATGLDGVLTIPAVYPLRLPDVRPSRQRFELPSSAVIFVTSFEPASDPDRKNPLATVEAFRRAFPDASRAMLVVKVNNPAGGHAAHPIMMRLRGECAHDPRLRLIEEPLTYQEVLTLYASCDVFVSLHRSEGLGLGLMEAMTLGKPVIATAWSGNMTYMNSGNGCLVSYRLVPVKSANEVYAKRLLGRSARWADPDIADAATWMKRLVEDPCLRGTIGLRAAESMRAHRQEADRGAFLDELTAIYENLQAMPSFQSKKARLLESEGQLLRGDKRRAVPVLVKRLLDRYVLWRIRRWSERN